MLLDLFHEADTEAAAADAIEVRDDTVAIEDHVVRVLLIVGSR